MKSVSTLRVVPTSHVDALTLAQARQIASFQLLEPTYLPEGLHFENVFHWSDVFDIEYRGESAVGGRTQISIVLIRELWSPPATLPSSIPSPPATPNIGGETIRIHGIPARIIRGFPAPTLITPDPLSAQYLSFEWSQNNLLLTVAGSVGKDELIKVAESLQ